MILVLNAGSSSIKFCLFRQAEGEALDLDCRGQVEGIYTNPRFTAQAPDGERLVEQRWEDGTTLGGHPGALDHLLAFLGTRGRGRSLQAIGHRVVHGGAQFSHPVRIDDATLASLDALVPLAPLHQPHNLAPIRRLRAQYPDLLQVACFDTAFHRSNPEVAQRFALPGRWHDAGVRRYGFHGLSYDYIASVLPTLDPVAAQGRTVVLHLGNGCSACALAQGRSIASSMGFTALDGLPMGTRCGALDPGVLLYLMDQHGLDARALERLLYHESGLLGVSGLSSDMRTLLSSSDPQAALAIDLFVYRIGREIGSLAAALGGLDALVFTAGIGENSAALRQRIGEAAAWLGLEFDAEANTRVDGPTLLSRPDSRVRAWVIPTNEEWMIARQVRAILGAS